MSTDFTPPEVDPPIAEEPQNPWAPLEERGFRADQYQPDEIVSGAQLMKAFNHRDYRDAAMGQMLRAYGFPEDLSPRELKELAEAQRQEPDPWAQVMGDPNEMYQQEYAQPQMPYVDPNAIQSAVQQQVQREIEAFRAEQARQSQQQQYEQEFTREIERVAKSNDFGSDEMLWLAADAAQLRQSMPYATTQEIADKAGERINSVINRRIQAMASRQQDTPAPGLPNAPLPSDQQVPQTMQDLREAGRRFFSN